MVNILRTLPSYKIELNIIQSGNVQYKQTESLNESLLNNLEIETDMDFYIKCSETVIGLAVLSTKIGHLNDFLNSVLIETISFEDIHFLSKFVKIDFEHKFELQHKLIGYIPEGLNQYLDVALVLYKENACEFNKYLHDTILKDGKCDLKIYFTGEKVFLKTKKENLNLHSKMIIEFEYENHAFLTNSKINNFNFKIRQCLDQIFEIYGKICYNIIKKGDFISKIKRPVLKICEIDLCCSIIITYIKNNNKINVLHSKNTDFLEEECVMNINNTVPCYLFSDHKDLKHTDFFTNKNVNILHGPNSSGKTSFVINIIQRIILNQIGFYSFNKNDKIKTFDELKYINDLSHVSDITSIKNNTFVFIDELLIDENLLDQLIKKNVFVIYVLHDIDFIKKDLLDSINIYKMENYTIFPNKACSSNALSIMEKHLYKELYECILLEYNNMYKK